MKICIPSKDDRGLEAEIHDHFGSAPWFTIVDTETGEADSVRNPSCHLAEGSCHHIDTLRSLGVVAVVSSGIGRRAWTALDDAGIKVFSAVARRVGDIPTALLNGDAELLDLGSTCGPHDGPSNGVGRRLHYGRGHAHRHPGRD